MVAIQKQVVIVAVKCPNYSHGVRDILRHNKKKLEPHYATTLAKTIKLLQQHTNPGMVFTDCFLNTEGGVRCIRAIKEKFPLAKLLVITENDPANIQKYISSGVHGIINRHTHLSQIQTALHHIHTTGQLYCCPATQQTLNGHHLTQAGNKRFLTHNEEQIILLSFEWKTCEEIGAILNLSTGTIYNYCQCIKQKLKANGFDTPLQYAQANGLI